MALLQIFMHGEPVTGLLVEHPDQIDALLDQFQTYAAFAGVVPDVLAREAVFDAEQCYFGNYDGRRRDVQRTAMIVHAVQNCGSELETIKREIIRDGAAFDLRPNRRAGVVAVARVKVATHDDLPERHDLPHAEIRSDGPVR